MQAQNKSSRKISNEYVAVNSSTMQVWGRRQGSRAFIKALVGIFIGICARTLYENITQQELNVSNKELCDECSQCRPEVSFALDDSIRQQYKPKGMFEVTRWYYFDHNYLYDIINEQTKVPLIGQWSEETQAITQVGIEYINANKLMGRQWKLVERENGYLRTDLFQGTEYLLDLKVKSTTDNMVQLFRVRLMHPFEPGPLEVDSYIQDVGNKVNIIVVLTGDRDNVQQFLTTYKLIQSMKPEVCLSLALFSGKGKHNQQFDETIAIMIQEWKETNKDACVTMHKITGDYNIVHGIKETTKSISGNEIILTMKDDILFDSDVIETCQSTASLGKRVYFPLVFAQFDPVNIENGMPPGQMTNVNKKDITKFTGHWLKAVHDFICAFSADFTTILHQTYSDVGTSAIDDEPMFTETSEFGTRMYDRFLTKNFKVISAVQPGFLRLFKNLNCESITIQSEKRKCLFRKLESAGSKPALNILYLINKDIKKS